MTNPAISAVLEVQEAPDGDLFIQFPPEMMEAMGWKEGDTINWQEQGDKSFILTKVN
jgi:hypothetical protein